MKITTSVTKSSHQDRCPCYLHLPIFFLYIHYPFLLENKKLCDRCFPQRIIPHNTVQLYCYSSVRIDFNIINKRHTLPVLYTMLV